MAKQTFASMSIDALLKLRNEVGAALSRKAEGLKKELRSLGSDYARVGRIAIYGRKSLKGKKVAPKYRGPGGETWAGRGAQPRWLAAAIKGGKKRDDFLIAKPTKAVKKSAKKTRRKKQSLGYPLARNV